MTDAPPGAEVPEGGIGEDAGPVTGEGLCYPEGGKISPEDIDELGRGVTFEVEYTYPAGIGISRKG